MGIIKQLNWIFLDSKFVDKFVDNSDTFIFQTNLHSYEEI